MADDKRLQSTGVEPHHRLLRLSGYAAAAAFCAVSVGANLQYGLSLGKNPIDKATYAVASAAADIFKMAAPLLALSLWSKLPHPRDSGACAVARLRQLVDGISYRFCVVEPWRGDR